MTIVLKDFQREVRDGIVARLHSVKQLSDRVQSSTAAQMQQVRQQEAVVVLQAPTGSGKTAIACSVLTEWTKVERVLWFWFAPFSGLVEQAKATLRAQTPKLPLLDLDSDRRQDAIDRGGIFVSTWSAVAAANAQSRKARSRGDDGLALDDLVLLARAAGLRIGCVVDEAHHGFHKAAQARRFFTDVLQPDYALMMTATPRDCDVAAFSEDTGWRAGETGDWASVSRVDAVQAGLLKRGVKVVRFLAKDGDAKQLIDFEQLALRECAETHRQLQQLLKNAGVAVTPLMLVQVPDGKVAQHKAAAYLTGALKFSPDSVRVHTADEPDPDLIALANDPKVEVLIFKMAVAMGFDAPRAFTLAALRGARDPNFGVQVIGRIVRVHAGLQGKSGLPEALNYGYVFLANAESQEGLMAAGDQINTLRTQAPELGTSLVFTVSGSRSQVQVVASGEPMALMLEASGAISTSRCESLDDSVDSDDAVAVRAQVDSWRPAAEGLFGAALGADAASVGPTAATSSGALARAALAAAPGMRVYKRRDGVPSTLRTESLPKPSADYELRLAVHVDFNAKVLGDRIRTRTTLNRREADLFRADHTHEDERDISASLSVQAVADRANDLLHAIAETHEREFRQRLLECFAKAIKNSDAPLPDQNELEDQLDLVLVRNPHLLREAYRSLRLTEVRVATVNLQSELVSEQALTPSQRNAYGVYPADLNEDERAVAQLLDRDKRVRWWHRNPPQKADSVGLYSWDEGAGFFPDFVLAVEGRTRLDEIALLEVKGHQLWRFDKEPEKSDAVHPDYGAVFMVGRKRGEKDFVVLKRQDAELKDNGRFSLERLLW